MRLFGGRERDRLVRELRAFETEWSVAKTGHEGETWAKAGNEYLERAKQLEQQRGDKEAAWLNLQAARRQAVYALSAAELAIRVRMLQAESQKLSSWREKAMRGVLDNDPASSAQIAAAMEVRDEYFQNRYHRLALVADQFKVLLLLAALALAAFVLLWTQPLPDDADLLHPRLIAAVLAMGLVGGSFSSAKSLFTTAFTNAAQGTIPERMTQSWVTLVRTLFGAAAGLAGYLFYESGILKITVGENGTATDLAIAFIFGYAGERLVSKIADAAGDGNRGS